MVESAQYAGEERESRDQLERMVELLGAYVTVVLTGSLIEEATDGGLTAAQYEALSFVHRHGDCSAKALSAGLRISIPSATRLVDRLVRKGRMDRRESGLDRRLVQLSVTPEGERALTAVRASRVARVQQALQTLPAGERAHLLTLLEHLLLAVLNDERTVNDCCQHCGSEHDAHCVVNEAHRALKGSSIAHP